MGTHEGYSPRNRAERVIAVGRLFLAVFLLVAVALDPTEPGVYAPLVGTLALGYAVYAAGVALLVWRRLATTGGVAIVSHAVDLLLFSLFMHFTESAGSPFFVTFVFATICGTLRWHGRGALLTGAAVLVIYVGVALGDVAFLRPGEFEMNRFIARCTQLAVVTGLLAYLGAYQHRLQREIARLATWPRRLPAAESDAVQEIVAYSTEVIGAPRVVLAWEEHDEPWLHVAASGRGKVEVTRERPDAFGALVAPALSQTSFLSRDAAASSPQVLHRSPAGFAAWRGAPLDPAFRERFGIRSVVGVRLSGDTIDGWLFALDNERISPDDILLGEIVGRLAAGALELNAVVERLRGAAAADERLRLARELHDGILQSLTAAALEAGRARHAVARNPAEAQGRLAKLEDTIRAEQAALRAAITDMKPVTDGGLVHDWGGRVRDAAVHVAGQWNIKLNLQIEPALPPLSQRTAHELVRMVQESMANAARHGGAKRVDLSIAANNGELKLALGYRGRGFKGFTGRHDLASLNAMKTGPWSLKERIAALEGSLVIDSTDQGARLEIAVPVRRES